MGWQSSLKKANKIIFLRQMTELRELLKIMPDLLFQLSASLSDRIIFLLLCINLYSIIYNL